MILLIKTSSNCFILTKFPLNAELQVGDTVRILKQNTSDEFIEGVIAEKISSLDHVRGSFVQLNDRTKGRVHALISHNLETLYTIKPENNFLEYKERFVLSPDEIKYDPMAWKIPFSIYKSVAAFANSGGGKLVIGIHNTGKFIGLQKDYDALKELKEIGKFTFTPDRDGFELKIKMDMTNYFMGNERYVLDLIDDIKFISDDGREICEIDVKPTYDTPVIIFVKNSNLNKKSIRYEIKQKIINEALEKQKLSHIPTQKSYSLTPDQKREHDELQKCPACFPEKKILEQIKYDPLNLFKEVNHKILFEDLKQIDISNEDVPLFFVRKLNSSEKYSIKDFIDYWIRRMKVNNKLNKN